MAQAHSTHFDIFMNLDMVRSFGGSRYAYNELRLRGLSVDVGSVTRTERNEQGNSVRRQLEVDFVCNLGYKRWYIQSALALPTQEKVDQEVASLRSIGDSFRKIVITGGLSSE